MLLDLKFPSWIFFFKFVLCLVLSLQPTRQGQSPFLFYCFKFITKLYLQPCSLISNCDLNFMAENDHVKVCILLLSYCIRTFFEKVLSFAKVPNVHNVS